MPLPGFVDLCGSQLSSQNFARFEAIAMLSAQAPDGNAAEWDILLAFVLLLGFSLFSPQLALRAIEPIVDLRPRLLASGFEVSLLSTA
jgi:hypothetical protein